MDKEVCKKFSQNLQRSTAEELDAAAFAHTHNRRSGVHLYISLLNRWTNVRWNDDLENFLLFPCKTTAGSLLRKHLQS